MSDGQHDVMGRLADLEMRLNTALAELYVLREQRNRGEGEPLAPPTDRRAEMVAFVREVLPELDMARAGNAHSFNTHRLDPGTRSLRVTFRLEGREILGVHLIPLPPNVVAIAGDSKRNPWGRLEAIVEQSDVSSELGMVDAGTTATERA